MVLQAAEKLHIKFGQISCGYLFVEPLGEVERLEVEGQKKASGFAHHDGLSRPVTKMAITLARPKFARQEAAAGQ